jgi:hypothetical protein
VGAENCGAKPPEAGSSLMIDQVGFQMKIAYESTIEEATNATFRMVELSGGVRKHMWIGMAVAPFIFIVLFFLVDEPVARLILCGVSTALFVAYWLLNHKNEFRKRIRKMLIRALGTDKPLPSEYELDDNGLIFRKVGQEVRFSWDNAATLNETEDVIEVVMAPMGIAQIPKRIFSSADELQAWMTFIQEHMRARWLAQ